MQEEKRKQWKIIIVGGGASGMMAAISSARTLGKGNKILLLEKNELLGKKLLATGNGRCNFMNINCSASDLKGKEEDGIYSDEKKIEQFFSYGALSQLSVEETKQLFFQMGILSRVEGEGRVYPYSGQGIVIKEALEAEIKRLGICIRSSSNVQSVKKRKNSFEVEIDNGECLFSSNVILATGGKAGLQYGSTGDGFAFAKSFGHQIMKPIPALVQLLCDKKSFGGCKGVRAKGKVSLLRENKVLATDIGEIQFTEDGVSGICVFNISRYVRFDKLENRLEEKYSVEIDLFPEWSKDELFTVLTEKQKREGKETIYSLLKGMIHEKLGAALLNRVEIKKEEIASMIAASKMEELSHLMKHWNIKINGTKSFKEAQVTCGGISTSEINPTTMESLLVPGLFFAGELIDIDGRCGGYNLQWAWSSGYGAGKAASKE